MKHPKLILAATVLLALPAFAQQAEEPGKRVYGPGVLTPAEVKDCVRDRNDVVALNAQLTAEKSRVTDEADSIERVEAGLVQQQREIDAARKELIGLNKGVKEGSTSNNLDTHLYNVKTFKSKQIAFNALVKTYNEGVTEQQANRDRHNASVLTLNARLDQLRNRANSVDQRCAGVRAYQEDVQQAREELGNLPTPPPAPQTP